MLAGPQREHLQEILGKMKAQNQTHDAGTPPGLPPTNDRSPLVDEVDPPNPWNSGNNIPIRTIPPPDDYNRGGPPPPIQPPPPIWNSAPVPAPVPSPAHIREPYSRDRYVTLNLIL